MRLLKFFILKILLIGQISFGDIIRPYDGQKLSYIYILFEWEQEPEVDYYQLEISNLLNGAVKIADSILTTTYVEDEFISFNRSFSWRIRGYNETQGYGTWIGPNSFTIKRSKLGNVIIDNYIDSLIQPGLTFFGGSNTERYSVILDKTGKEIWNDGGIDFKINYIDKYGSLFGNSDFDLPNNKACKINYDLEILWSSNELVDNHDMKETPWNTYFVMRNVYTDGPIPSNNEMTQQFRNLGYVADDSTSEFPWYGQEIIEMDSNNQVLWRWNPFDYFSINDFDNHGHSWSEAYRLLEYDWTHSNAMFFDEEESSIYLSSRHLSRITKINYPSGEVVYNISLPPPFINSGDLYIGNNLLFNFQHHIEKIGDNNFTLFDNGNISSLIFEHEQRISRALEYEVIGDSITNIVWEYQLAANLYGSAGGSMSILENDNRLIYTRANPGAMIRPTVLEVTKDKEIVWKMTGFETGSWYRVFRIPNIHPDRYSILFKNLKEINNLDSLTNVITIDRSNPQLVFKIFNESAYAQFYKYKLLDLKGWFENIQDTVRINPGENLELSFNPNFSVGSQIDTIVNQFNLITLEIEPVYHSYNKKIFKFNLINSLIIPDHIKVYQNYPNPFNNTTTIRFDLQSDSHVDLIIYDVLGNKIKTLVNKIILSGQKSIQWNGMNNIGENVSSGIYFYKIRIGDYYRTNKMLFIK